MSSTTSDRTHTAPFRVLKSMDDTHGEFVRFEATLHPRPDAPRADDKLDHHRWAADNADEHVHPNQEERMEVLSGTYRVVIDGQEHTLHEGDDITIPVGTPHRHWNPTDQPIRTIKEDRPARNSEAFFWNLYALAQTGRTDEEGLPSFLQFAVLQNAYPGHAYMTDLPVGVQKTLFSFLGPLGHMLGYHAEHHLEHVDPAAEARH